MTDTKEEQKLDLASFLSSVRLETEVSDPTPMITEQLTSSQEDVSEEERFLSSMAAVVFNMEDGEGRFDKSTIQSLIGQIDGLIADQMDEILHNEKFQEMESAWTSVADLVGQTNFRANIGLSLLDVSKDEAFEDLEMNVADIGGSELFKKIYVAEYDQYGGHPFGGVVGLYDFANTRKDILWLKSMGKIATASHAPFVGAVNPKFFGCDTAKEMGGLRDIAGMIDTPKYSAWNDFRDSEEAAYIGLTMPRFILREPYNDETNPAEDINYEETVRGDQDSDFLWGNSAILFARNLVKSFEQSAWCQYIRGPKGGGLVRGLATHTYNLTGEDELKPPVEIAMPDHREYELATAGFIPLIHKKGSADAVFFSAQSIKKAHKFKDPKDSENSQLVTNLSYTFSITRIAHYLKCIMRDNIGSSADAVYIQNQIDAWISRYVTTIVNPDDLTLRYYPFKAYSLDVEEVPGKLGWYHCNLSVLPHIQFEGMDVDLRVDARLG